MPLRLSRAIAVFVVGSAAAACAVHDAATTELPPDAAAAPVPVDDAGATAPVDAGSDAGRTICQADCVPTRFAAAPGATGLACAPGKLYAGTAKGKLLAFDLATHASVELAKPDGAVGFVTHANGALYYTLPARGEVHARDLATGIDTRLAKNEADPQGIAVSGTDVFFVTSTELRRVAIRGIDQAPSTRVTFADADPVWDVGGGFGLALTGAGFLVTHPEFDGIAVYAKAGAPLEVQRHALPATSITTGATLAYYAQSDGKLYAQAPFEKLARRIATEQLYVGGMCVQDGRLYFVNDGEIRWIDVE